MSKTVNISKKKMIFIGFVCLVVFIIGSGVTGKAVPVKPVVQEGKQLISLSIKDYSRYIQTNSPLDEVYRLDEIGYFLVNSNELDSIEKSGTPIIGKEPVEKFIRRIQPPDGISSPTGDVNGAFHSYSETVAMLNDLQKRFPSLASVGSMGHSAEGRELQYIKISNNVSIDENEPNIYLLGCHHAREWLSVEVPLLFAQYLLENYAVNSEVRNAIDHSQIFILPVCNPDGLEFSIQTYRMWRKNRKYNGDLSWGVDINRNYGYKWGFDNIGSSSDPWDETYRGTAAFSEPETNMIRTFLISHPPAGLISYHTYSQLILYPWSYTYTEPPDVDIFMKIALEMQTRIFKVNGRLYKYGSSDQLYLTNGDTSDWVYGTFGAPAFTIELPPLEFTEGGFFTSEKMISEVYNENIPALLYFVNYFAASENQPAPLILKKEKFNTSGYEQNLNALNE